MYQPKTGERCTCKRGIERDNCPHCEGTGWRIDFAAIRNNKVRAFYGPSGVYYDATGTAYPAPPLTQARGPGSYSFPAYDPFKRGTK